MEIQNFQSINDDKVSDFLKIWSRAFKLELGLCPIKHWFFIFIFSIFQKCKLSTGKKKRKFRCIWIFYMNVYPSMSIVCFAIQERTWAYISHLFVLSLLNFSSYCLKYVRYNLNKYFLWYFSYQHDSNLLLNLILFIKWYRFSHFYIKGWFKIAYYIWFYSSNDVGFHICIWRSIYISYILFLFICTILHNVVISTPNNIMLILAYLISNKI